MRDPYPSRSTVPEHVEHVIRIQGAGASAPVNEVAPGVTVTRTGTGAYRITWAQNPGTYVAGFPAIEAATPGDVAGHTVVLDTYANKVQDFVLYNATPAAHDLAASEYINLRIVFKTTAVS